MIGSKWQLAIMTSLLLATPAGAQQDDLAQLLLETKFEIDLGVFFPDKERAFRVNGSTDIESPFVDFDEELKLKHSEEVFSAQIGWRINDKWRLAAQYFGVSDANTATLNEDLVWEDIVYEAGATVSGATSFKVIRVMLSRDLLSEPHHSFGVGFGIHQMEIILSVAGDALVQGGGTEFRSESVKANAPMPNIGAWYRRRLSSRWLFSTRLDWLSASIDPYDGTIVNAAIGVNYAISEHMSAGLHYNYFNLDGGIEDSSWRGEAKIRFNGPYISVKAFW